MYNDTLQNRAIGQSEIFKALHFTYDTRTGADNDAPSLLETMSLLAEAGNVIDDVMLKCEDPCISQRLVWDARRFRYTRNLVSFTYHFIRLRMFENKENAHSAKLEALALRDIGLRAEKEMTRHIRGRKFRHPELYLDGLAATWLPQAYAQVMDDYGLETPDTPEGKLATKKSDLAFA
jgi:hypothetical protein